MGKSVTLSPVPQTLSWQRRKFLTFTAIVSLLVFLLLSILGFSGIVLWKMSRPTLAFAATRPLFDQGSYLSDGQLGWRLFPNYKVYDETKEHLLFETDRYGFRNPHRELPKAGKAILLGDSFVQGYYLSEEESIRGQLQRNWPGYIYNFGIGGYSTDQEFLVGKAALEKFKADWVVLFFYHNDLPYLTESNAWNMTKSKFVVREGRVDFNQVLSRPFAQHQGEVFPTNTEFPNRIRVRPRAQYDSGAFDLFQSLWKNELTTLWRRVLSQTSPRDQGLELTRSRGENAYRDAGVLSADWDLAFQFFTELNRLSREQGSQFLVFHIPEWAQIKSGEAYFAPQAEFERRCFLSQLHCLEPHSIYAEKSQEEALYFIDDGHFAPPGAALAADLVSQYIEGKRLAKQ